MDIKVENRYCKGSARKIRPLLHLAKGKSAEEAERRFRFVKSYGKEIWELIKNSISIANKNDLEPNKIFIKAIHCEKAKELKRHRYESKGRVTRITKHQHHLFLTITDDLPSGLSIKSASKPKKPLIKEVA